MDGGFIITLMGQNMKGIGKTITKKESGVNNGRTALRIKEAIKKGGSTDTGCLFGPTALNMKEIFLKMT